MSRPPEPGEDVPGAPPALVSARGRDVPRADSSSVTDRPVPGLPVEVRTGTPPAVLLAVAALLAGATVALLLRRRGGRAAAGFVEIPW